MPDLSETLRSVERRLAEAGLDSARADARILVAHATGIDRARLVGRMDAATNDLEIERIEELTVRRLRREPIALIVGAREFWSLPFRVTGATLVPRPDSETLIEAALEHCRDRKRAWRILDLGTGSGCLLLAMLSELPQALGFGIDRSADALAVAALNARALKLSDRARFAASDWASALVGRFDVVLCNPPYIAGVDWASLDADVRCHEPSGALLAGADGLDAYRAVAPQLSACMADGGVFVAEIGLGQAAPVGKILTGAGLDVRSIRRDLSGRERCLLATAA